MDTRDFVALIRRHDTNLNNWWEAARKSYPNVDEAILAAIRQCDSRDAWRTLKALDELRSPVKMQLFALGQTYGFQSEEYKYGKTSSVDLINRLCELFARAGYRRLEGEPH